MGKICKKCGAGLTLVGSRLRCRPCRNAAASAYYATNAETLKAKSRQWGMENKEKVKQRDAARYAANPEKFKAKSSAWYAENKERARAAGVKYRLANMERCREVSRKYYEANKEASLRTSREWVKANPERRKEIVAKWSKANPESGRTSCRKRRALTKGAIGPHHTVSDFLLCITVQDKCCWYCGFPFPMKIHADHVVPLSKGGGNGPDNIVASCPDCNLSKANRLLGSEWIPPIYGILKQKDLTDPF